MIASILDLVAFLRRYHRDWLGDPRLDPGTLPADVPPPLAILYRELGGLTRLSDQPAPFYAQDQLLAPEYLKWSEGYLTFAGENQGNWSARCALGLDDPPVYSDSAEVGREDAHGFELVCSSLTRFLITLCLQEAAFSSRHVVAVRSDVGPEECLKVPVVPLWVAGPYVDDRSFDFYVTDDHETLVMYRDGLYIASPRIALLERLRPEVKYCVLNSA